MKFASIPESGIPVAGIVVAIVILLIFLPTIIALVVFLWKRATEAKKKKHARYRQPRVELGSVYPSPPIDTPHAVEDNYNNSAPREGELSMACVSIGTARLSTDDYIISAEYANYEVDMKDFHKN